MNDKINNLEEMLGKNAFAIFQIEPDFKIDLNKLKQNLHLLQKKFHPDNWINHELFPLAISVSAHINTSYTKLKNPLERASLLLNLNGFKLDLSTDTKLPEQFLFEQMEFHEHLEEAADDIDKLEDLKKELQYKEEQLIAILAEAFKLQQFTQAIEFCKQLSFYQRLLNLIANQINQAL